MFLKISQILQEKDSIKKVSEILNSVNYRQVSTLPNLSKILSYVFFVNHTNLWIISCLNTSVVFAKVIANSAAY